VSARIEVVALPHAGEITTGTDLAALVLEPAPPLEDGDVVVITHKAVSKSEGRVVDLATVRPSPEAVGLSREGGDARIAELVLQESRRIVRRRGALVIAETHHGFVCASAGIDRSNGPAAGWAVLLPKDPDASAARLRTELERRTGARLAVIVADTMGRALRRGIVGTAIGVSGLEAAQLRRRPRPGRVRAAHDGRCRRRRAGGGRGPRDRQARAGARGARPRVWRRG